MVRGGEKRRKTVKTALGAGGRVFESLRPDHLLQGVTAFAVTPFFVLSAVGAKMLYRCASNFPDSNLEVTEKYSFLSK